jgi:hypothetical protein
MTKNCVATVTTGCAFPFSQMPQETERWRAMHSPGVRVYEGHAFRQRSPRPGGCNPLPELAVAKSGWSTADGDDTLCWRHNTCPSGVGIVDAGHIQTASSPQACALRNASLTPTITSSGVLSVLLSWGYWLELEEKPRSRGCSYRHNLRWKKSFPSTMPAWEQLCSRRSKTDSLPGD